MSSNLSAGYQLTALCYLHPGQTILQACTDVNCTNYPFLCIRKHNLKSQYLGRLCLQDQFQLQLHQTHGNALKCYEEFLISMSKQLSDQQATTILNYKEIFTKQENLSILSWINESDEHLQQIERFIRSQKYLIQDDIKQIIEEFQLVLNMTQKHMFERLDEYFNSYKQTLNSLKEIAEPLNLMLTKYKYYTNVNNLRTKVNCGQGTLRTSHIIKLKNCLHMSKLLEQEDKGKQIEKISRAFYEINKALDSLPQYTNQSINKTSEEVTRIMQDFFTQNLIVRDITSVGPFILTAQSLPQTQQKDKDVIVNQTQNDIHIQSFLNQQQDDTLLNVTPSRIMKDDILVEQPTEFRRGRSDNDLDSYIDPEDCILKPKTEKSKITTIFPFADACSARDSRITEHLIVNQLLAKNNMNIKFKIKRKLTFDSFITSIGLLSQNILSLGFKDGSIKVLDLITNKGFIIHLVNKLVSFYPNAFITHFDQVVCVQALKNTRTNTLRKSNSGIYMLRLASSSLDTNIIIWTLGENNMPYPERKLVGFEKPIIRMVDVEDGAHLVAANIQGDIYVVNYHDNRVPFQFKYPININMLNKSKFIYLTKQEKFATVTNNNQITFYSLGFKQMQLFSLHQNPNDSLTSNTLLMSCELEQTFQAPSFGTITCCLGVDLNNSFILCYGTTQGNLICYDTKKNIIITNSQLYTTSILEIVVYRNISEVKQGQQGFLLVGIAENDLKIKSLLIGQEEKIKKNDSFGELIESSYTSNTKFLCQALQKSGNDNRAALITLNKNQKDISILELN